MNRLSTFLVALTLPIFAGCASVTYTPPSHDNAPTNYSAVLNQTFDQVWTSLINYSANNFFSIDNYEKDSGLITLGFGAATPSDYIKGGWYKYGRAEGEFVDMLTRNRNGKLNGRMNIVVSPLSPHTTQVTIKARYIFKIPPNDRFPAETWVFDSGTCSTTPSCEHAPEKGPRTRTLCPTYKAERAILEALRHQLKKGKL